MRITETFTIDGRRFDIGILGTTRIVVLRTGIGMVHAEAAARTVVRHFRPAIMVFSGVAGSYLNIGDVAVPLTWVERKSNAVSTSDPTLLAIAEQLAAAPPPFVQCALVPPRPPNQMLCLPQPLKLVVGGTGQTDDPYNGQAAPCTHGADDVFGCAPEPLAARGGEPLAAEDMETGSVARVANEVGIPFIGFRAVSDGAGDPLGLDGFFEQFFNYYHIAADNAAAATIAFLARWSGGAGIVARGAAPGGGAPAVGAACQWHASISASCAADQPSAKLTERIAAVCALLARLPDTTGAAKVKKLERQARARWRKAAQLAKSRRQGLSGDCRTDVADALRARGKVAKK
jgi:nucleoside phosphorylase